MLDDIGNYAASVINLVENPLVWQVQGPISGVGKGMYRYGSQSEAMWAEQQGTVGAVRRSTAFGVNVQ